LTQPSTEATTQEDREHGAASRRRTTGEIGEKKSSDLSKKKGKSTAALPTHDFPGEKGKEEILREKEEKVTSVPPPLEGRKKKKKGKS